MSVQMLIGDMAQRETRPVVPAMKRGFRGRCPHCGNGKLFRAYVKPVDNCAVCGEDYTPQRADDLPAYIVVSIVGHIVVGGFMATEMLTNWSSWQHLALWIPAAIILSLGLLQPVKGAIIGLQWANYMHGFGGEDDHVNVI